VIVRPAEQRETERAVIAALLRATRERDVDGMLAVLAPDVVRRSKLKDQPLTELHGVNAFTRDALRNTGAARRAELVWIDGQPGLIVAPRGRLTTALRFSVSGERITMMEVITEPRALDKLELRLLELSSRARWSATQ
jgi:RNA polymerase sigma-70 factor (ECF subfamily)